MNRGAHNSERGVSFVEMMVVMALVSIVGIIFFQIFIGTMKATMFVESRNDLSMFTQRAVNEVREQVMQAKRLMLDDTYGNSYLTALTLDSNRPIFADSVLPVLDSNGGIAPDTTPRRVGNILLLAANQEPLSSMVDHDGDSSTAEVERLADIYRFKCYYLSSVAERDFAGKGFYLDLVAATSDRHADYFQLNGMDSALRSQVAQDLYADGVTIAWDPTVAAGSAFYQIQSDGSLSGPMSPNVDLTGLTRSVIPQLRGGRIAGSMVYSVGLNGVVPSSGRATVAEFGVAAGEFPAGFETLVVGPAGKREVFARLVLMSQNIDDIWADTASVTVSSPQF